MCVYVSGKFFFYLTSLYKEWLEVGTVVSVSSLSVSLPSECVASGLLAIAEVLMNKLLKKRAGLRSIDSRYR